jgi:hypothetical protein
MSPKRLMGASSSSGTRRVGGRLAGGAAAAAVAVEVGVAAKVGACCVLFDILIFVSPSPLSGIVTFNFIDADKVMEAIRFARLFRAGKKYRVKIAYSQYTFCYFFETLEI